MSGILERENAAMHLPFLADRRCDLSSRKPAAHTLSQSMEASTAENANKVMMATLKIRSAAKRAPFRRPRLSAGGRDPRLGPLERIVSGVTRFGHDHKRQRNGPIAFWFLIPDAQTDEC